MIFLFTPQQQKNMEKILVDVLKICETNNLKLNREIPNIGKDQVECIAHILSRDGLKISSKIIESIKNMSDPMSVKGSYDHSWHGNIYFQIFCQIYLA